MKRSEPILNTFSPSLLAHSIRTQYCIESIGHLHSSTIINFFFSFVVKIILFKNYRFQLISLIHCTHSAEMHSIRSNELWWKVSWKTLCHHNSHLDSGSVINISDFVRFGRDFVCFGRFVAVACFVDWCVRDADTFKFTNQHDMTV